MVFRVFIIYQHVYISRQHLLSITCIYVYLACKQGHNAVTAHLKLKQLLPFVGFARHFSQYVFFSMYTYVCIGTKGPYIIVEADLPVVNEFNKILQSL